MKKFLSLLLALCLIVGMLPMVVLAEEATPAQDPAYFNINTTNASLHTNASLTLKPGDTKYYTTGEYYPDTYPGVYMFKATTDTENYNVKFDYPVGGQPTVYLKGATIYNACGFYYGAASDKYINTMPLKIVVESDSTITNNYKISGDKKYYYDSPMTLKTRADVTITGPGKLTVSAAYYSATTGGVITVSGGGNLILDKANVAINISDVGSTSCHAFAVKEADLIIDASEVQVRGYSTTRYCTHAVFYLPENATTGAGGNLTIRNYSNVKAIVTSGNPYTKEKITVDGVSKQYTIRRSNSSVAIDGVFSVDGSDVELVDIGYGYGNVFKHQPDMIQTTIEGTDIVAETEILPTLTMTNCTAVGSSSSPAYDAATDILTPLSASSLKTYTTSKTGLNYFKITHACVAGEPVLEGGAVCSTTKDKVTYCTLCKAELSREQITVTPDQIHTPGTAEVVDQVNSVLDSETSTYTTGYYKTETKCTVCGEVVETAEVPFEAGLFYLPTSGQADYSAIAVTKLFAINPGQTLYYTTVQNASTSTYPDGAYRATGSADNWNIKIEYPIMGQPTVTLKGAKIKNDFGFYYGIPAHNAKAPLKIVVEEDSVIGTAFDGELTGLRYTIHGALNLHTTEDVTITGPGKLTLSGVEYNEHQAIVFSNGDITFENANVELIKSNKSTYDSNGIYTSCGDITFKNAKVYIKGLDSDSNEAANAFISILRAKAVDEKGGNIIIEDGSDVTIIASAYYNSDNGMSRAVQADKQIIIRDSCVEFLLGAGQNRTSLFTANGKPVLEFTKNYTVTASTAQGKLTEDLTTLTVPDTGMVDFATTTRSLYYFKILMTGEVAGTSVTLGNTLDMNFAFDKEIVGTEGYVEFIKGDGETVQVPLADCAADDNYYILTFPGVAAKEMKEAIKVTIYNAKGEAVSEAYTDSIADYALRMLRGEKPSDHTDEQFAALKTLLVDTLIYASMAQVQFNYETDDLVTEKLTPDELALASGTVEYPEETAAVTEGEGYMGTSFILENTIRMAIAVSKRVVGEGATATVTFTNNAGDIVSAELTIDETYSGRDAYVFISDDLVAADGRCDITFTVFTAAGEERTTVTDSLINYVGRMVEKYPHLEEIAKYCNAAEAYFNLRNATAE